MVHLSEAEHFEEVNLAGARLAAQQPTFIAAEQFGRLRQRQFAGEARSSQALTELGIGSLIRIFRWGGHRAWSIAPLDQYTKNAYCSCLPK